jgi:diguanylate cyclase (GGDEF)-like protein
MNEQRFSVAIGLGIAGVVTGLVAAVTRRRTLALLAAAAGAGSVAVARRTGRDVSGLEDRLTSMGEQIRQLENAVAAQVQGRMTAEQAVRSLNTELLEAERRAGTKRPIPLTIDDNVGATSAAGGLTDDRTGLFNHDYFLVSLDSRIAAARRHLRPVAVVLVDVVQGRNGTDRPAAEPRMVADCLRETLRDSDTATRLKDGRYGVVLEDTPENGAIWTMERLRRCLAEENAEITMWAGVACYPAHAFDVAALVERADRALSDARDWHQDRIEVATAE